MTTKAKRSTINSAATEFSAAYRAHAEAVAAVRAAEQALADATRLIENLWPSPEAESVVTPSGTIRRATKSSFTLTAEPEQLVQFAQAHGLAITAPKPATVAPATIRAAALRGIDVADVADETTSFVYSLN